MANEVRVLITAVDKATPKLNDVTKASVALGGTFAALGAASVKMSMDFEKGLSQVAAVSGATGQEMEKLRGKALQIGADTAFSASEAVGAMQMLAQQGVSTTDILGGATDAVAALAAAGGTDLTTAANVASTAMITWGKSAADLGGVVNYIAGVANLSKFGVEDMAAAMAQGGGVAASAGVSFEEFATAITATAASFASGSDAGTSFKTFLTRLADPSKEAAAAMAQIGFSAYDAQGNLKSMADITQNLHDALGPLTEEQRAQAAATIFGSDAMRTALGLAKLTGDEFAAMNSKMASTDASEVAATRMNNLAGQMEQLRGSLETLSISIGSTVVPMLTNLAGGATTVANAFGELPASTQSLALLTVGVTALAPSFVTMGQKAIAALRAIGTEAMSTQAKTAGVLGVIGLLVTALDLIVAKTSGHGLLEWMSGDAQKAEAAAKALKSFEGALKAAGKTASEEELAFSRVGEILNTSITRIADFSEKYSKIAKSDPVRFGFLIKEEDRKLTKEFGAEIDLLGQKMKDLPLPVLQLEFERLNATTPGLAKRFGEASGATAAWAANLADLNSKSQVDFTTALNELDLLSKGIEGTSGKSLEAIPGLSAFVDELWRGEDGAKNAAKRIQELNQILQESDPIVASLQSQIAILAKEEADLKAKGDDLTSTERERLKVIQDTKSSLEDSLAAHQATYDVIDKTQPAIEMLMGDKGYSGLREALKLLNVPAENISSLMANLGGIFTKITDSDIPGAMGAFKKLEGSLSPDVWGVIWTEMAKGGTEAIRKILLAWENGAARITALGRGIIEGISTGLGDSSSAVDAGVSAVSDTTDAMFEEAEINSPSKVTQRLGEGLIEGLALGLEVGAPLVFEKGKWTVSTLLGVMAEIAADEKQVDILGSAGVSLIKALDEAIAKGGEGPVTRVAGIVDQMVKALNSKAPEAQAAFLGSKLLDALNRAITENTPEARNALADLLAQINTVLEGGAIDIRNGATVAGDQIAAIAKAFGVSGKSALDVIRAMVGAGMSGILSQLGTLPAGVKSTIEQIVAAVESGAMDIATAAAKITAALATLGVGTGGATQTGGIDPVTGDPIKDSNGNLVAVPGYDWVFDPSSGGWTLVPVNYGSQIPAAGGFSETNKPPVGYTSSDFPGLVWNGSSWQSINVPLPGGASPMPVDTNLNTWFGSGVGNSPTFGGQAGIAVGTQNSYGYYWDGSKWVNHPVAVPSHALGTPYVTHDGLAFLHQGEAVIPADQNKMGGASVINLVVDGQVLARVVNTHNSRAGVR